MKKCVYLLVVCVLLYVRSDVCQKGKDFLSKYLPMFARNAKFIPSCMDSPSGKYAPIDSEMVWLKDVTTSFETDKRTLSDFDLPDKLTFNLTSRSHTLTLILKRNRRIDPNADIYFVRKLKDGRSLLKKTQNLEKEDLAYYQDRENGAFMTVRCVKISNGHCERVIYGNIRIGDRNYDLRPAESDVTSKNSLDVLLGTRYVLHDQADIQREISVKDKDSAKVNEKNIEKKRIDQLRRFPHGQEEQNHFHLRNSNLSARNIRDKKNRVKDVYWVEVAVLIDSGIWDLFLSLVETHDAQEKNDLADIKIREFYSHVINGVNLLYNGIEDPRIEISVTLRALFIFTTTGDFPHRNSKIWTDKGKTNIDAEKYLKDITYWDWTIGSTSGINYDHAMLFTRHDLFESTFNSSVITGLCRTGGVCLTGSRTSVVQTGDFFMTVTTAAHELGHSLGAGHDGDRSAQACKAEDLFIMSPINPKFDPAKPYSRNPWIFSKCSVEAFKTTLKTKECVTNIGVFFNEEEWMKYVRKQPGEVYTPNEQCEFINGPTSVFCGVVDADICRFMKCMDPKTRQCLPQYFSAARGTKCGPNMWCKEGMCVSKASTQGDSAVCHTKASMKSENLQDF